MSGAALARLPLARIARTPRAWGTIVAWFALGAGAAIALRSSGAATASDVLVTTFGGLALPFLAFAIVGAALGGDGLARSTRSLVAFGAPPARVALVTIGVAVGITALAAALLGPLVAALAHGAADPPLARDAATTAWVSALGGATYAALFAFGSSFGKRGGGRAWALVLDWLLGSGAGIGGAITPRANVRSLLGGDAVGELAGRWSALLLVVLALLFTSLALRRSRRA